MKRFEFLIIFFFLLTNCSEKAARNANKIPYLKNEDLQKIDDKREKELQYGCIVHSTTQGAYELEKILDDSTYFSSDNEKRLFCLSLIKNNLLYHLHDIAGYALASLLRNEDKVSFLINNTNESSLNYCLMHINHPNDSLIPPGGPFFELDSIKQRELISYLNDNRLSLSSKIYILDGLYSLTFKESTGKNIYRKVSSLMLDKQLLSHNDSLYNLYLKLKPRFESLNKIQTWMEMDKNIDNIESMLNEYHPIMFLQVLCFNPSTVLDSKKLCKLKEKALSNTIKRAKEREFFKDIKYVYLNELLIDGNYVVRFLDGVMRRKAIPDYRIMLENE